MATPNATPTTAAKKKAPTISKDVTQRCCAQTVSPCHSAFHTAMGEGSRYSRMPPALTAACQLARRKANSATVGQYWRSKCWNLVMRSRTFGHTGEAPQQRQAE